MWYITWMHAGSLYRWMEHLWIVTSPASKV